MNFIIQHESCRELPGEPVRVRDVEAGPAETGALEKKVDE